MRRQPRAAALALAALLASLAAALPAAAEGPAISGSIETSAAASLGAGASPAFSLGFEEYANLRLKAKAGERGTVHAALNLVAASGSLAPPEAVLAAAPYATPFVSGGGYAAALELERLYCRITGETMDLEAGLLRLAFGYGQAFSPMDFLSARNPLLPEARPRGVLGAAASVYPSEMARIEAFAAAGSDPFETSGEGALAGALGELHGRSTSLEALYAYEAPSTAYGRGVHRAGLSLKLEAGAGVALDALYSHDGGERSGLGGLEGSLGLDYSLGGGDLYLLCQYLYRGRGSVGDLTGGNYLYAVASWRVDDYRSISLASTANLDDLSALSFLSYETEPFQGLAVLLRAALPLDRAALGGGDGEGDLGPDALGYRVSFSARAKLRF